MSLLQGCANLGANAYRADKTFEEDVQVSEKDAAVYCDGSPCAEVPVQVVHRGRPAWVVFGAALGIELAVTVVGASIWTQTKPTVGDCNAVACGTGEVMGFVGFLALGTDL